MDPPRQDGPDDTSIKPVSSLLARFEKMNNSTADQPPTPTATTAPTPRTASPAPKPDSLRDQTARDPPPVQRLSKPKPKEPPSLPNVQASAPAGNGPTRSVMPPPLLAPRPAAPSLMVQPPQSPPKGKVVASLQEDAASFLNPDSVVKSASPTSSPRAFKIPSRPHTPVLEPGRSPRLTPSQPPSPPPPRRSGELRRERERVGPPPVNRAEKPLISSRNSYLGDLNGPTDLRKHIAERASPFSSPPSSNGSVDEDDDHPPDLPSRPRPRFDAPPKANTTIPVGFAPPPVHHTVASWRKEREDEPNGYARGQITPQLTGEQRPPLPSRPVTIAEQVPARSNTLPMPPPPRPPRPGVQIPSATPSAAPDSSQKRVVSTPTTQQQAPLPLRTHGRSMTVDRTSNRVPKEFRVAAIPPARPEVRVETAMPPTMASSSRGESRTPVTTAWPDSSNTSRRPPYVKAGVSEIPTKYDARIFDVCGEYVVTSGNLTRVWNLRDGELLMSLAHGEGVKATSVAFKPGANVNEEGLRVWIGNNFGEVMEADVPTCGLVAHKPAVHGRHEVIKIYRHFTEMWTLDDSGTLHIWGPGEAGVPELARGPHQSHRVPKGHTFSIIVGDELWHATGKDIRVFAPTTDGRAQFQVLLRALYQESAGEVTSGTLLPSDPDKVIFGHVDGKVSVYSRSDYTCQGVFSVSTYKINSLTGCGKYVWAGYNTGKLSVFDIDQTPWVLKKEWQAHDNPVVKVIADRSSCYRLDRCQVVSLGADNFLRAWDGLLQEDWLEGEMKARDAEYAQFEQLKVMAMTWNAGASTPNSLRYSDGDAVFVQNLLQSSDSPDILVFGFQELVDLEDKTATAKRFLRPKKKEGSDQERMSHQYRDWRDFLIRSLDDYMPEHLYHLLHTANLVGLFTCIFVKADIRDRIRNLSSAEVKRGLGGLHGNKGAIVVRFMVDDTSLCFINCHLAAGQSQANSRHADVAAILDSALLPAERDAGIRIDSYVGGGDGTMILDHELCLLNGDLNYRIDTMSRDTVVMAVKSNNLAKLLERDQLLVARRRNPAFRLRAFDEGAISFAPTYKYDVGTDNYDSSEKKRSPAWCDRLLYRGRGRIRQLEYRRHEVRVSDHRPVTGRFLYTVKTISPKKRAEAWMVCQQQFEDLKVRLSTEEKMYYLTEVIGYDTATAKSLIKELSARRRSPVRRAE